jgi:hypothetical protein
MKLNRKVSRMHAAMDRFADTYPDWLEYVEKDVDGELHKDWYFTSPNGDKLFIQELTYSSKPGHNYRVTGYGALEWKEFDTFDEALAYAEKLHNGEETMKMASRKACDCKKGPHGEKGPHGPMHGEPHPENPMHISQDNDSFDTAVEIKDLDQAAEDDLGKDESEVKKAEWIATRIAERKLKAKLNDEVMHHLASMGSKTAMLAVGKILDRKAFDSYKKEAKTFKPSNALRLNREARLKRWANRKIAYGDDWEIFIGAVEDPTNGEWVTLPTSDSDIDAAIERAQEGPDGEFYEEVMIADTTFGAGADIEYMDPHEVNEYISDFENSGYDKDFIQTLIDDLGFEQAANEIDDVEYYEDVNDEQDLGYAVVEAFGGVENLDPDTLQSYFNYESFGRDLTFEGYNIDNGFAYRVAMHNRLARKIDTMRVIALIEKNLK